jgi:tRNA(fMet)-specific endonuclease VapC
MIVLDTDHLSVHAFSESARFQVLAARISESQEEFGTTIVCLEERLRGWLAAVKRKQDISDQIPVYRRLGRLWHYLRAWIILPFDDESAEVFKALRKQKIRIGSQDLKIAAIALSQNALLLSANLRDFRQVPGLRVENWLESNGQGSSK